MIYRSERMTLHSIMDVFQGEVNDVVICEEVTKGRGSYYTLLAVKDHETVKKLLRIIEQSDRTMDCCVDMFSCNGRFCMVFPFTKERRLNDFYMADAVSLAVCEEICLSLLLQCMSSTLPYPLLELVIKQGQIHLLKDNSIVLGYCLDLSELDENRGQKECTMQCAICVMELLQQKEGRKNVSYQLLQKKIPKQSYQDFRELYKDIRLTKTRIQKTGLKNRWKSIWRRNEYWICRALFYLIVIMILVVAAMFIFDVIWGENPFFRFFINPFKYIGTESLTK